MSLVSSLLTVAVGVIGVISVLALILTIYIKRSFNYWKKRKATEVPPSFPFGNYTDTVLGKTTIALRSQEIYKEYRHERYVGTYFSSVPLMQVHDPEILKQVFVKDFATFNGRGLFSNPDRDILSGHLFFLSGPKWKNLRIKLTPTFTTGKIKYMFEKMKSCALEFQSVLESEVKAEGGASNVDIREFLARFSTDVISSVAFGIEPNSLKNPNSEFRKIGKRVFEPTFSLGVRMMCTFFATGLMDLFRMRTTTSDVNDFMMKVVPETVEYREKNNIDRPDFLNLMIQLKNKGFLASDTVLEGHETPAEENGHGENGTAQKTMQKLTMDEIIAQAFVFFVAGYETTSSTTSFTLYELSKNQEIQKKVIKEIDAVLAKNNGKITYDCLSELTYTEQVIHETLRLHPAVPFLTRASTKPCKLPLTDVNLEAGTKIMIPVVALHYDPEYFPDPETFNPDRFSEENKQSIVPFTYLPFGDGPRICIGMRFGMTQVKVGLMSVLSKFRVERGPRTPDKITLEPRGVIPIPQGGMILKLISRT